MDKFDSTSDWKTQARIPYALRHVPDESLSCLLPCADSTRPGDIALARVEQLGRNTHLELRDGRRCSLHRDDLIVVVFGNRYATLQFEGYARAEGDRCDLLSMGGLCGLVETKHSACGEPTKLHLLGFIGDTGGRKLRLRQFALAAKSLSCKPPVRVVVVCGSSMDAGKTHTAMSVIAGLHKEGHTVAAAKLTGTATGRDRFKMLDAGAHVALDFVDGGLASTYLCELEELMHLHNLFLASADSYHADCLVIEIADGLLQNETAALLQSVRFCETVDAWIFAAGDPLSAAAGVRVMRSWRITPLAISGVVSMSPLGIREAQAATAIPCFTAGQLQAGELNEQIMKGSIPVPAPSADQSLYQRAESRVAG